MRLLHDCGPWDSALRRCVDGTSVGDAFGEQFFGDEDVARGRVARRDAPPGIWKFTDDTVMTCAVADVLSRHGSIDADALAARIAELYARDPSRGFGGTAHGILRAIRVGIPWETAAGRVFDGMGSMGNGAAMRAAPIGVRFAGDLDATVQNAHRSAGVTHAHAEGAAGAIAVAVAASLVAARAEHDPALLLEAVIAATPASETRRGLERARQVPFHHSGRSAGAVLGNGSQLCAHDTVPFAVWAALGHLDDYADALWTTVDALGDRDTTCAIVGGIVCAGRPAQGIPRAWLAAREELVD